MRTAQITIRIDSELLAAMDQLIEQGVFPNRSAAIQGALPSYLNKLRRARFVRECNKLDPKFEKALAEEGFGAQLESRS